MTLKSTKDQARTRLLLTLWELGGTGTAVKKSELLKKTKRDGETSGDYQEFFEELSEKGAIALRKEKQTVLVSSVTDGVRDLLVKTFRNPSFEFDAQLGVGKANVLLALMRSMQANVPASQKDQLKVASYEEFKGVALEVFDRLNKEFNMDNLVPIYRIRREIGDQVTRSQFDEWLLEMQTNNVVQLIGGEMPELTPDKAEDSIKTTLGAIRYYAKRL